MEETKKDIEMEREQLREDNLQLSQRIGTQPWEADMTVGYSDSDIIMIDNARLLAEPSTARLQMNMVAFCCKGRAHMDMNGKQTQLEEGQLLVCPPNVSLTNFMLSPDFEFKAIFVTNRMLQSFLHEKMNMRNLKITM